MNILNDNFMVRYDDESKSLLIIHPDKEQFLRPLVELRETTLKDMNFAEASQFIGERLILLIPQMRALYESEFHKCD